MGKLFSAFYLVYAGLIFICLMLIMLPFILFVSVLFPGRRGRITGLFFLRMWAWVFSLLAFFWMRTENKAFINRDRPHIYIANHGSYLDAIAVCIGIPQPFSPLGKIEMARIPVFGWIYSRMVIMIDRQSKESREKSVETLKVEINAGQSILIFPEGTMNKSERPLGAFYDGAFRIALETQTAIQPFIIRRNRDLLPRTKPLAAHPGMITISFLPAVEVAGLSLENLDALKELVHQQMTNALLNIP